VLGSVGLYGRVGPDALELGYWIRTDVTGRGYASEVSEALTAAAFRDCGVARVEVRCEPNHVASAAIPRRLGFTHTRMIKEPARIAGAEPVDLMVWELHAREHVR